jgi:tetratricopeptide (TPR) repeat protein
MSINYDIIFNNISTKRQKKDISQYIDNIRDAFKTDNFIDAKTNIDIIIQTEPLNINAHLFLAYIYIKQKDISNLIKCCKTIIKIQPNNFHFYYNLGNCYIKKNKLSKAEIYLLDCLKINPTYIKARKKLIYIYTSRKELFNQKIQYEEIFKYEPTDKDIIYNIQLINKIFENIIQKYNIYFCTSIEIKSNNDLFQIENLINNIINTNKTDLLIRFILLDYLYVLHRYEEYINLNKSILIIDNNNLEANNNLLKLYIKLKKYEDAKFICLNILLIDNHNSDALFNLAKMYYKDNEYEESIIICNKILMDKIENLYINTYFIMINIYIKQHKLDDAEIYIRKILEIDKFNLSIYELLIQILNKNNKIEEVLIVNDKKLEIEFYTLLVDLV